MGGVAACWLVLVVPTLACGKEGGRKGFVRDELRTAPAKRAFEALNMIF